MPNCASDELVQAFVEDRLPAGERADLESHLGDCDACCALVARVTEAWFAQRDEGRAEKPAELAAGARVGPYTIVAFAGRGGMGDVYRARDPRLGRDVAIKVLPARFAGDADRRGRARLEALATGRVVHPNAVTVFDAGTHDGVPYLVTEWLTGTTLQERLARGKLPIAQVRRIGAQLARALGAAHDRGVIHRDLKPGNVFLGADGSCKILDFGVARLVASLEEPRPETATEPGTQVGTVGYMSPEQIRGEEVDPRTDLFALGAVLHEMITGQKPFGGRSLIERMTATLRDEPPPCGGELERIVARCLAKSPADRFQSAHDLAFHLETTSGAAQAPQAAEVAAPPSPRPRRLLRALGLGALLAAGIAAASFHVGRRTAIHPAPAEPPTYRAITFARGQILAARYSNDGHTVVYGASWDGGPPQLYTTRTELPGTKPLGIQADVRAISARGELAMLLDPQFFESATPSGTLARMRLGAGAPRAVLEHVFEADWSPSGDELAAVSKTGTRYRLEYPIGTIRYEGEAWPSHIRVAPDGRRVALLLHRDPKDDMGSVAILDGNGPPRELSRGWTSTRGLAFGPGGKEIWFTAARTGAQYALYAVDEDGRERLIDRIAGSMLLHDVAADGRALIERRDHRAALYAGEGGSERDLTWSDSSFLTGMSADGRTLLYAEEDASEGPDYGAYLRTADGAPPVRLGDGTPVDLAPDGRWAAIRRAGPPDTLALVPTGAGTARALSIAPLATLFDGRFFPDGRHLLLRGIAGAGHLPRLWVHDLDASAPRPITAEGVAPIAAISPDGDRIAAVGADGTMHLYGARGEDRGEVPGRFPDHIAIGFHHDGASVYLRTRSIPVHVRRVHLTSGAVTEHLALPSGGPRPGLASIMTLFLSADGRSYAYCTSETLSRLYIVEGLK
ncbi:protein kinase domain-containing protein [Pendulispora albinea]|uniref:Protein kinase n=1 Tax=Pendulispora albinea TaxID=2741071 RepID=A0ABZ2M5U9_9BACT